MDFRETAFQGVVFAALVLAGAASATLYDVLRAPLRNCGWALQVIMDAFLTSASAFLCFIALYVTNAGPIRAYMALAFFLGAALYSLGVRQAAALLTNPLRGKRKSHRGGE